MLADKSFLKIKQNFLSELSIFRSKNMKDIVNSIEIKASLNSEVTTLVFVNI